MILVIKSVIALKKPKQFFLKSFFLEQSHFSYFLYTQKLFPPLREKKTNISTITTYYNKIKKWEGLMRLSPYALALSTYVTTINSRWIQTKSISKTHLNRPFRSVLRYTYIYISQTQLAGDPDDARSQGFWVSFHSRSEVRSLHSPIFSAISTVKLQILVSPIDVVRGNPKSCDFSLFFFFF